MIFRMPFLAVARFGRLSFTAALLATLAACGGGGDDGPDLPCGGGQALSIAVAYEVNGTLLDVASTITLPRNVYVQATPRIVGLPAACAGKAHVTVSAETTTSPGGITLDRATGVMSGTATIRGIFDLQLKITVDGYTFPVFQNINVFI